jgi:hypothetical protein
LGPTIALEKITKRAYSVKFMRNMAKHLVKRRGGRCLEEDATVA